MQHTRKWKFYRITHANKEIVVGYRNCKAPDLTELYKEMKREGFGYDFKEFGYVDMEDEQRGYRNLFPKVN